MSQDGHNEAWVQEVAFEITREMNITPSVFARIHRAPGTAIAKRAWHFTNVWIIHPRADTDGSGRVNSRVNSPCPGPIP